MSCIRLLALFILHICCFVSFLPFLITHLFVSVWKHRFIFIVSYNQYYFVAHIFSSLARELLFIGSPVLLSGPHNFFQPFLSFWHHKIFQAHLFLPFLFPGGTLVSFTEQWYLEMMSYTSGVLICTGVSLFFSLSEDRARKCICCLLIHTLHLCDLCHSVCTLKT
jgi:hypothetical protein